MRAGNPAPMFMSDTLTLDAPKRTKEGYLAVRARSARAGVQDYLGVEVDPKGTRFGATDVVPVYRPADEVFDARSLHSFLMKPITNDHPKEAVTSANWKDHAGGVVAKAIRDGDHVAFDLILMDKDLIADVDAGKRGLSNGYDTELTFEDGNTPEGQPYKAVQRAISGNHVAVVRAGRAGELARIGDTMPHCDALPLTILHDSGERTVKTMLIDGLTVDISNADTAQATIATILAARDAATAKVTGLEAQVATLTTDKTTLDAKVVTLEQAIKDAKPTPAQLRDAGKSLMLTADKARALGVTVTDAMDEPAIMTATVTAKMGDAAKDWNEAQIAASFAVLTKDAKASDATIHPITTPRVIVANDGASVRNLARDMQHN